MGHSYTHSVMDDCVENYCWIEPLAWVFVILFAVICCCRAVSRADATRARPANTTTRVQAEQNTVQDGVVQRPRTKQMHLRSGPRLQLSHHFQIGQSDSFAIVLQ